MVHALSSALIVFNSSLLVAPRGLWSTLTPFAVSPLSKWCLNMNASTGRKCGVRARQMRSAPPISPPLLRADTNSALASSTGANRNRADGVRRFLFLISPSCLGRAWARRLTRGVREAGPMDAPWRKRRERSLRCGSSLPRCGSG
ncbi:hypothetical protein DFH09DRAFT_393004 [Mycena vulgaris]|nr:hypothetical protein DFH09DRAFT_393004 [Mycena vulgaris]